jgi:hypothetical protein
MAAATRPGTAPSGAVLGLSLAGLALMVASFFAPMWWVSLTAPNYPEHMYPHGVRIVLHWTRVAHGCTAQQREREEISEDEVLDCVEEMNTINHYIGMHPIDRGAQLEFKAAPYLFVAFGVLAVVGLFYTGPLWWFLFVPAIALPVGFLVDFAGWLYWFATTHEWAAFTVAVHAHGVRREGRPVQHLSFPDYGIGLSIAGSVCLVLAVLQRRKQLVAAAAAHTEQGVASA